MFVDGPPELCEPLIEALCANVTSRMRARRFAFRLKELRQAKLLNAEED